MVPFFEGLVLGSPAQKLGLSGVHSFDWVLVDLNFKGTRTGERWAPGLGVRSEVEGGILGLLELPEGRQAVYTLAQSAEQAVTRSEPTKPGEVARPSLQDVLISLHAVSGSRTRRGAPAPLGAHLTELLFRVDRKHHSPHNRCLRLQRI